MNKDKKEKAIKDINVKELNANWRTWLILAIFASLVLGFVGGYFASISIITESQGKAMEVVKDLATLKQ